MGEHINIEEQLDWFTHSAIKIMDIRHIRMKLGEALDAYRLPANAFMFTLRGSASVSLDNREYICRKFQVLHGAKGCYMDIRPSEEAFDYYLILYKAAQSALAAKERQRLIDVVSPVCVQYHFVPAQPLSIYERLQLLEREWKEKGKLSRLHAKSLFYDFIYELLRQLDEQNVSGVQRELVEQAVRFIHEHYAEPITLERLAHALECSPRHLTRMFRKRMAFSPIDYLIRLRVDRAKAIIAETDAALQEIAERVGFSDVYFFSRTFKKHTGFSPTQYKTDAAAQSLRPYNPSPVSRFPIVSRRRSQHTVIVDNHYHRKVEGVYRMNRSSKQSFAIVMLLTLTLLVSACGGTAQSPGANGTAPSASSAAVTDQPATERVLKDALGNDVTLPDKPERVLASYLEDHLVALGVQPVAQWSVGEGKVQNYLQEQLGSVPTIPSELPLEAVMSYQPDLIIIDNAEMVMGDKYADYAKIAPTFTVGSDVNTDWRQELMKVGEVLNKSEEAKQVLAAYEEKAGAAKEQLKQAIGGKTAAVLWVTAKNVYVVNQLLSSGDVLYRDLGLTVPSVVEEISIDAKANWNALSAEKLAELEADYLFIVNSKGVTTEELVSDPIWKGIPAVQNGNVFAFDNQSSWLYTGSIANSQMIDDVLESIGS